MIYGIHGMVRSGKTLYMTMWAFMHYLWGRKIYSNYNLYFSTVNQLTEMGITKYLKKHYSHDITQIQLHRPEKIDPDDIIRRMPESAYELENSTLCVDEVYNYADARRSIEERNLILSHFLLQSGKHNTDVFMTSQQLRLEDVRLEENSFYEIFCTRVPRDMYQPLEAVILQIRNNYNKKIIYRGAWLDFHLYMDMYDTSEIIEYSKISKQEREEEIRRSISNMKRT